MNKGMNDRAIAEAVAKKERLLVAVMPETADLIAALRAAVPKICYGCAGRRPLMGDLHTARFSKETYPCLAADERAILDRIPK